MLKNSRRLCLRCLDEECVIVGIIDGHIWFVPGKIHAFLNTIPPVGGATVYKIVGNLVNNRSSLGQETGRFQVPEGRAELDLSGVFVL